MQVLFPKHFTPARLAGFGNELIISWRDCTAISELSRRRIALQRLAAIGRE
jgi:hypothetical protein